MINITRLIVQSSNQLNYFANNSSSNTKYSAPYIQAKNLPYSTDQHAIVYKTELVLPLILSYTFKYLVKIVRPEQVCSHARSVFTRLLLIEISLTAL